MKLFLASSTDKTLSLLKEVAPNIGTEVLFVANASDPYEGDHWWVELDRQAFKQYGFNIREVDLRSTTPQALEQMLRESDVLHVCGGSVYYLVALLRDKRLDEVITRAICDTTLVYTGASAGSIIVSDNIKAFSYDPEEAEHVKKVPDHRGLGIVDFAIVPHVGNPHFADEHARILAQLPNDNTALFFLYDNQVLWVEDGKLQLLSVPAGGMF
jgi:dipeptidase E